MQGGDQNFTKILCEKGLLKFGILNQSCNYTNDSDVLGECMKSIETESLGDLTIKYQYS